MALPLETGVLGLELQPQRTDQLSPLTEPESGNGPWQHVQRARKMGAGVGKAVEKAAQGAAGSTCFPPEHGHGRGREILRTSPLERLLS